MAEGVRARPGPLIAAWLVGALAAQGGERRAADDGARALVDKLLERHHGPLRGAVSTALIEVRDKAGDEPLSLLVSLPDNLRAHHADGTWELLRGTRGWRARAGEPAEPSTEKAVAALVAWRERARALLLEPLYRARKVARQGPGILQLVLPGGETWRLACDERALRIDSLRGPSGEVRFVDYLVTKATRMPTRIATESLGERDVRIAELGIVLRDGVFDVLGAAVPDDPGTGAPRSIELPGDAARERPREAQLQRIDPRLALVLDDPGDWPGRVATIDAAARALERQGQWAMGLPLYRAHAGAAQILIGFRPDPETGRPFVARPGQRVVQIVAHRAVVIAPPTGRWDEAVQRGRAAIDAFVAKHELQPAGPLRVVPFLIPDRVPSERALGKLQLRLELPVR